MASSEVENPTDKDRLLLEHEFCQLLFYVNFTRVQPQNHRVLSKRQVTD